MCRVIVFVELSSYCRFTWHTVEHCTWYSTTADLLAIMCEVNIQLNAQTIQNRLLCCAHKCHGKVKVTFTASSMVFGAVTFGTAKWLGPVVIVPNVHPSGSVFGVAVLSVG